LPRSAPVAVGEVHVAKPAADASDSCRQVPLLEVYVEAVQQEAERRRTYLVDQHQALLRRLDEVGLVAVDRLRHYLDTRSGGSVSASVDCLHRRRSSPLSLDTRHVEATAYAAERPPHKHGA
jgi:hypothetical protein